MGPLQHAHGHGLANAHVLSIINNLLFSVLTSLQLSQVTSVELKEVLSQEAYMLFYCRYVCVCVLVNGRPLFLLFLLTLHFKPFFFLPFSCLV